MIGAIVQARTGSSRFPNKVLHPVDGKSMLQYLLERLQRSPSLDTIIVATSTGAPDAAIADFCRQYGTDCYRGSLDNVAERFHQVLNVYHFDAFVRVSADSPLLDQRLIDKATGIFSNGDFDIVTNVMPPSYPKGQSVEVLRTTAYRQAYPKMREAEDLEHVTRYFYKHSEDFRIHNFSRPDNLNGIKLSVDTRQDMDRFSAIISRMIRPHWEYSLEEILELYHSLP
jgi:spore coat polysaccharide biosynthesis protein SpsF